MNYNFLNHLNSSDLNELEKILLEDDSKEELLKQIKSIRNYTINFTNLDFKSDYIPNYDQNLEKECIEILKQLKVNDLFFFLGTFMNKGNTRYTYPTKYIFREVKNEYILSKYRILIDLVWRIYQHYGTTSNSKPILYLDTINKMFENSIFQEDFEGPYNMLNYIKNYIYFLLEQDKNMTVEDVFLDYQKKRELVTIQIRDISSYLCEIRNGTNLRLCISNAGLIKNTKKTGEVLSFDQSLFVDALAFGTTFEKIKNRDYEDYKKLLYLPTGKNLKK